MDAKAPSNWPRPWPVCQMTEDPEAPGGSVAPIVVGGAVLVALATPLNLFLLLFCRGLIAAIAGPYAGKGYGVGLVLILVVANVGVFLALCGLAALAFRRSSLYWRRVAVFVVLFLYMGLWHGWSFAYIARKAVTGGV